MDRIIPRKSFNYFFLIIFILSLFAPNEGSAQSSWSNKKACAVIAGTIVGLSGIGAGIGILTQPLRADADVKIEVTDIKKYRVRNIEYGARDAEIEKTFTSYKLDLPTERVKVRFHPQVHADANYKKGNPLSEDVIRSQFQIANYIFKHPDHAYFDEGVFEDLPHFSQMPPELLRKEKEFITSSKGENKKMTVAEISQRIHQIFPKGLPEKFEDLTYEQKERLYFDGAGGLAWWLGKTDKLQADDLAIMLKFFELLKSRNLDAPPEDLQKYPEIARFNYVREKRNLVRMALFQKANPNREIDLIFGAFHQFEAYNGKYFDIEVVEP